MKEILKILGIVAVSLLAGACLHRCQNPSPPAEGMMEIPAVTDTITVRDTIFYKLPTAKMETGLGARVIMVPVFSPKDRPADAGDESGAKGSDTVTNGFAEGGLLADSVAVEVPITQREYEGEDYHAWVSGYDPRLDSIRVYARREEVTIRHPPEGEKRWGVGVFAGYGLTPAGPQPCIGISVNYNLWKF